MVDKTERERREGERETEERGRAGGREIIVSWLSQVDGCMTGASDIAGSCC